MCPFILFCAILLFVITRFANLHLSCDAMPSVHKMLDFKYILDSMISNIILLFMVFIASDAILYPSAKCWISHVCYRNIIFAVALFQTFRIHHLTHKICQKLSTFKIIPTTTILIPHPHYREDEEVLFWRGMSGKIATYHNHHLVARHHHYHHHHYYHLCTIL